MKYETVIGLEIHVELKTQTKIFCSCSTAFGAPPNTQICPVCMGMPGALPVLNKTAVEYAVRAGLALNCAIASYSKLDRKNYVYPDLPKAYQISQCDLPICADGSMTIDTEAGEKTVRITRIHLEEDAGKLVHDQQHGTLIDCNRCSVPLIEIVTEPDLRSPVEAVAFLEKLRSILLYTDISDLKMNEGSMRCDVNLSVRPFGESTFGARAEIKNLNSFQSVRRAAEYEAARQIAALEAGEAIIQQTRRFDQTTGMTYAMRSKENADDYRYFPDPDLCAIELSRAYIEEVAASLPELPEVRKRRYMERYQISLQFAAQLCLKREDAEYFESVAEKTAYPKIAASLITGELFRLRLEEESIAAHIEADKLAALCERIGNGALSASAGKRILKHMWEFGGDPARIEEELGLTKLTDEKILKAHIEDALNSSPQAVDDYRAGKKEALQAVIGIVMKSTNGRADPIKLKELLIRQIG
ncbi:MAG TPA: Asp-tRNA(Asn)/Glu-tRNA(Gln) amidotransferase subunit GatB [Clostridia bacterium]|nr:Asp-tRNA(Asn)/Glu-tRNA(Gln) amidotransferase subunit GatB [Clostridia bacterium]